MTNPNEVPEWLPDRSGILSMATGAGKTFTFLALLQSLGDPEMAHALDAGMAQLAEAVWRNAPVVTQHDVALADERGEPSEPVQRRAPIDRLALALILLWLAALAMPAAQLRLPPEAQDTLNTLYATIGLALAVTWRMRDNHKR